MPFPPHAPHQPRSDDALPLRGVTLLVVEDSRFASDALRLICMRLGARLRRAETLAAARVWLAAHRPDAVIVDLGLPDGRGEGLITHLASLGLPVLGTSGDPEGRAPALAAGAAGFLEKPVISVAAFQRLVLGLLGAPGAAAEAAAPAVPPADPLAFRDDLTRASALIGGDDSAYATGFVRSLARSAGDQALEDAALAAGSAPGRAALARLLALRLAQPQGLS